jgi:hypothetical protein
MNLSTYLLPTLFLPPCFLWDQLDGFLAPSFSFSLPHSLRIRICRVVCLFPSGKIEVRCKKWRVWWGKLHLDYFFQFINVSVVSGHRHCRHFTLNLYQRQRFKTLNETTLHTYRKTSNETNAYFCETTTWSATCSAIPAFFSREKYRRSLRAILVHRLLCLRCCCGANCVAFLAVHAKNFWISGNLSLQEAMAPLLNSSGFPLSPWWSSWC